MATNSVREEWRPVVGWEGRYSVSNLGRIKSHIKSRIMRPKMDKGYLMLHLSRPRRYLTVHRIVSVAFLGPPPSARHQVNHKNGIKTDNRVVNLEWATVRENIRHSYDVLGKVTVPPRLCGERNHKAKLTADTVRAIRSLRGVPYPELAARFGVSTVNIGFIIRRATWKHI